MTPVPLIVDSLWDRNTPCPYHDVIDVRSPGEYAEDHIPGAINLPVLDDAERAAVGTLDRESGAFAARRLGAGLVSANIGRHLQNYFFDKPKDYRPLIYCWRGGHRSASLATVLARVGWRTTVLNGGYKIYRAHVRRELETLPDHFQFRIVAGGTGTGKTALLHALAARGAQVLDLENLAAHRGSILGSHGRQPSQKEFDSRLLTAFASLDPARPVWIESESNRIGDLFLPPALWRAMKAAKGIELRVSVTGRVRRLLADYRRLTADPEAIRHRLATLVRRHGSRQIEVWNRWIELGDWPALVESLLVVHYDPSYRVSNRKCFPNIRDVLELPDSETTTLERSAEQLLDSSREHGFGNDRNPG